VADAALASPIRLSFRGLKAEVASRCGQWPHDLASGSSIDGWKNESYWNFGCATQSVLAAQVDDPRDFARARALGPADEEMRLRAIKDVREGKDPGTNWVTKLTSIGQVGGN
jgi:pilus assembly protein CpaD